MGNTVNDERRRLRERLALLNEECRQISYTLTVLDRIEPEAEPQPTVAARSSAATAAISPSAERVSGGRTAGTREHAVRAVLTAGRPTRVEDLVVIMREQGWSRDIENPVDAARAALSRAYRDGEIDRPTQGLYAPPGQSTQQAHASQEPVRESSPDLTDNGQVGEQQFG